MLHIFNICTLYYIIHLLIYQPITSYFKLYFFQFSSVITQVIQCHLYFTLFSRVRNGVFSLIFDPFLSSNHYMWWSNLIISPPNHNVVMQYSFSISPPSTPDTFVHHFNIVQPYSPLFSFLILKFINLQGKTLLKFEYSFSFSLLYFQSFFQYFKYFSLFYFSFFYIFSFFFSFIFSL